MDLAGQFEGIQRERALDPLSQFLVSLLAEYSLTSAVWLTAVHSHEGPVPSVDSPVVLAHVGAWSAAEEVRDMLAVYVARGGAPGRARRGPEHGTRWAAQVRAVEFWNGYQAGLDGVGVGITKPEELPEGDPRRHFFTGYMCGAVVSGRCSMPDDPEVAALLAGVVKSDLGVV